MPESTSLPYLINDADEHSTPRAGAWEEYIDPDKRDLAIRTVVDTDGRRRTLYNGRGPRLPLKDSHILASSDQLVDVGVTSAGRSAEDGTVVPGSLLNRLNPLKGMNFAGLFSTHPPLQERIRRLRTMRLAAS